MTLIAKKSGDIHSIIDNLLLRNERIMLPAVRKWFAVMLKQIRSDLTSKYIRKDITSEFTDWDKARADGMAIMKPAAMEVYVAGGNAANKIFNVPGGFDALTVDAAGQVNRVCANLVREVGEETKEGIRIFIKEGIKRGKGMPQVARELRPLVGLTKLQTKSIINYEKLLAEKHPEISAKMRDYKVKQYASKTQTRRLNTIARTETACAQNYGYAQSMKEIGVEQLELSATVGACSLCAGMNGNKYDIDKAGDIIPGHTHPSCRCAMLPVVGGKTISKPQKVLPSELEPKPGLELVPPRKATLTEAADMKELEELRVGNEVLRDELKGLKANNKRLASEIEGTKKKVGELKAGNKRLQEGLERKTKEIGSLKTELATTKKRIKVLEREIEEFVPLNFVGTISDNFKSIVKEQVNLFPNKVRRALNSQGIQFRAGKKLTEIFPELKGRHPRGWPRGTTWDSASGVYNIEAKSISVVEYYRPIGKKTFVAAPKNQIKGVLNHETGHGFDKTKSIFLPYSGNPEFKAAYIKDVKKLARIDYAKRRHLNYYLQKGNAGRSEAFAEVFANRMGQGALLTMKDINLFFPSCNKYMKGLLK